jgi:type IV pilus assembly protein PilW
MYEPRAYFYPAAAPRQRGLTMIELMISITIGLFLVGAIGYLYISSRGAYRSNAAQSRIQEDGRFGLDALMHDARAVGDFGCSSSANVRTVAGLAPLSLPGDAGFARAFAGPSTALFGVDASSYAFPPTTVTTSFVPPAVANIPSWYAGDVLQMVVPTSKPVPLTADADSAGNTVTISDNSAGLRPNDYLLIANCINASITQVGALPTGAGPYVVGLYAQPLLPANVVPQMTLATHPSAQRVDAVTYYVGLFPGRQWPALYRYSATYGVAEEVVDHVENMSVRYGGVGPTPESAQAITLANAWDKVNSIRVSLQVVGDEQSTAGPAVPVSLDFGTSYNAPDTKLRQVFTATAALRNRLP